MSFSGRSVEKTVCLDSGPGMFPHSSSFCRSSRETFLEATRRDDQRSLTLAYPSDFLGIERRRISHGRAGNSDGDGAGAGVLFLAKRRTIRGGLDVREGRDIWNVNKR